MKKRYYSHSIYCLFFLILINSPSIKAQLQFPSTNDPQKQLLVTVTSLNPQFYIDATQYTPIKSPYWAGSNASQFTQILNKNENGIQGFLKLDNNGYILGWFASHSANQTLKFKNINSFASTIFLSYDAACYVRDNNDILISDGTPILKVSVSKMKLYDIINNTPNAPIITEVFSLNVGQHISSTTQAPKCNSIKHPAQDSYGYYIYTIPIVLNKENLGLAISEIDISLMCQNGNIPYEITLAGLNLQTNIYNTNVPVRFAQGHENASDPWPSGWGQKTMNNPNVKLSDKGCIVTSAAMAMRYLGLNNDPAGNPLTPGTLTDWLNANNGFDNYGNVFPPKTYYAFQDFANHALTKNNGNSIKIDPLASFQIGFTSGKSQDDIRNNVENALCNNIPVLIRVARRPCSECKSEGHTMMAYGMIPDFTNNIFGTYKIMDPGIGLGYPMPTLYGRDACSDKGKFSYAHIFNVYPGVSIIPNALQAILCSPGKLYILLSALCRQTFFEFIRG